MEQVQREMESRAAKVIGAKKKVVEYEEANDTDTESVPVITNNSVDLMDIINVHETGMEM